MSFHLDQLLGAERQAACAAHDLSSINSSAPKWTCANSREVAPPTLNRYIVREFRHGTLQRKYETTAVDVVAAVTDAIGQAPVDCKVDVMSESEWSQLVANSMHAYSRETQAWHAENARHAARGGVL